MHVDSGCCRIGGSGVAGWRKDRSSGAGWRARSGSCVDHAAGARRHRRESRAWVRLRTRPSCRRRLGRRRGDHGFARDGRRSRAGDPGRFGTVPRLPRSGRHPVGRLRDAILLGDRRSVRSRLRFRRTHPLRRERPGRRRRSSSPRASATKSRDRGYGPRQAVDTASRWLPGEGRAPRRTKREPVRGRGVATFRAAVDEVRNAVRGGVRSEARASRRDAPFNRRRERDGPKERRTGSAKGVPRRRRARSSIRSYGSHRCPVDRARARC